MRTLTFALVLLLGLSACRRPEDQTTESIDREDVRAARTDPPRVLVVQLDSGNAAYKVKDWERALRHYRRVTEMDDEMTAGWFGIYMTEMARGNGPAADSALRRAQEHAPGATLIHP